MGIEDKDIEDRLADLFEQSWERLSDYIDSARLYGGACDMLGESVSEIPFFIDVENHEACVKSLQKAYKEAVVVKKIGELYLKLDQPENIKKGVQGNIEYADYIIDLWEKHVCLSLEMLRKNDYVLGKDVL